MTQVLAISDVTAAILKSPATILFLDTCSILDLLRATKRSQTDLIVVAQKLAGLAGQNPPALHLAITQQVEAEWLRNEAGVLDEIRKDLGDFNLRIIALESACTYLGIKRSRNCRISVDDVITALVELCKSIISRSFVIENDAECCLLAHRRAVQNIPPSRKGKGSGDCDIIEHVLGQCRLLRSQGFAEKMIFISSNTNDYLGADHQLLPELESDFSQTQLTFVRNIGEAYGELS
jgi:hypothetical protein